MIKNFTNSFLQNSLNIPIIQNLDDLSNKIGLSKRILYLMSKKTNYFYNEIFIPKKDGTKRKIYSPSYALKLTQRWILEEILQKIKPSSQSMAFIKGFGTGILKNAKIHKDSLYLLQLDLKDFFTSIKRSRVFYLFQDLGYNKLIANLLTNLCTYKGYLPQGAVTSPYISNLICFKLDKRLNALSNSRDILYSRYADDLTFSCNNKDNLRKLKDFIIQIIKEENFVINEKKTRFLSPKSHRHVTGLTIDNKKVYVNKKIKKKVRTMIFNSIISGDYADNDTIKGYIAFINSVEKDYKKKVIRYVNKIIKKDIRFFQETVEAFNNNKLFDEIDDMQYFSTIPKGFYDDLTEARYKYIKERNLKNNLNIDININDNQ